MKRIISLIIATILCFSFASPTFAENPKKDESDYINIYYGDDGLWKKGYQKITRSESIKIKADEKFDTIYFSDTNGYFKKIDDTSYMPVEKIEIKLNDKEIAEKVVAYEMPKEVRDGIAGMVALAKENNCSDAALTFFAPRDAKANNFLPKSTTIWRDKTFNHYQVYFTGMWSQPQPVFSANATSKAVLTTVKDLAVFVVGETDIGPLVSIYSLGRSCLNAWKAITGNNNDPIFCNIDNSVYVDVCYDIYLKYTYYLDEELNIEFPGCSSQRVVIKRIDTDTYLYTSSGGSKAEETVYPNKTYVTPNYWEPEYTAYMYHHAVWTETVRGKIPYEDTNGNSREKIINFSWPNFTWPSNWPN